MADTYDSITLSYTESKHVTLAVYYWPKKGKELSMKEKAQFITPMRVREDRFSETENRPNVRE